jgi:hypothetical protein
VPRGHVTSLIIMARDYSFHPTKQLMAMDINGCRLTITKNTSIM